MGVLNSQEIERLFNKMQLISNPRPGQNGRRFDIQDDSYDLSAGTAVWKTPTSNRYGGNVETRSYSPELPANAQPTVTVLPGQMIFVVTHENIAMPRCLCDTVYSRNSLALAGILALNAGHVDSGYHGPIVIRLINLRAIPWTLTLGDAIFTITFQTVDGNQSAPPMRDLRYSQEYMIGRVRETANAALSNALYDLYEVAVEKRLDEFKAQALEEFNKAGWVRRDELWSVLLDVWWKRILAGLLYLAVVAAPIVALVIYLLSQGGE